jgi:acetoin utilization deacetylase AcuC-like enzyme
LRVYYCDQFEIPLPAGHKFPVQKYRLLREALEADGVFDLQPAPLAPVEVVELAHDPSYIKAFVDGTMPASAMRRIGFPWSQGLVQRTFASVGSTLQSAWDLLELSTRRWGISGGLAGGTHHAFHAEGAGFCVFNDVAVAIRALQNAGRIRRAAVIDLDVHQGDGTASIFQNDPSVLTFSMHAANNFPPHKQKSDIDVELADFTGDDVYLAALVEPLSEVWRFEPEIVFFQSGVDTLHSDRLGRLSLTAEGLRRRDHLVLAGARSRRVPLVVTLGGGYSEPIEATVAANANTFRIAAQTVDPAVLASIIGSRQGNEGEW